MVAIVVSQFPSKEEVEQTTTTDQPMCCNQGPSNQGSQTGGQAVVVEDLKKKLKATQLVVWFLFVLYVAFQGFVLTPEKVALQSRLADLEFITA